MQGLLYILKDIIQSKIVVAGDATNDVPFLQIGDEIYAATGISNLINKEENCFNKADDKTELLRRIFNE